MNRTKNKQSIVKSPKKRRAILPVTRKIEPLTRVILFVSAGGRCEFDGCNKFLLEHPITIREGNFAQMAHIVAFSEEGPRGSGLRPKVVNDVNNLMLLCPECHKLIDDRPGDYTIATLEGYKNKHEERIRHVTGLGPDLKTTVVQLKTRIAGQSVAIPIAQVTEAVSPRYPTDARGYIIDLTNLNVEEKTFVETAAEAIRREVERLYAPGMDLEQTRHISLFALAPIPLLVFMGNQLSNKVPVDLYQRHRDTEDWVWKSSGKPAEYKFQKLRDGHERDCVALLLSLSGKIHADTLPPEINDAYTLYEITLAEDDPKPTYLRLREDLTNFKEIYQTALRSILRDHGNIESLHLFPAVPAPVAILCGRELLPKVDPRLLVYDYDKKANGFRLVLKVN